MFHSGKNSDTQRRTGGVEGAGCDGLDGVLPIGAKGDFDADVVFGKARHEALFVAVLEKDAEIEAELRR